MCSLWIYWIPHLTISLGENLNKAETLQTQFVVTNTGHITIYGIGFWCTAGGLGRPKHIEMNIGKTAPIVDALAPNASVSRGCFVHSETSDGDYLRVTAWFFWPVIRNLDSVTSYFRVRQTSDGFALVPDVEPPASSPIKFAPVPGL